MKDEHSFSVQLKSKDNVKNICLNNETEILFEGYLGELESLGHIEGALIELKGCNGILKVDLTKDQLMQLLNPRGEQS